jgi:hypothetical protein
MGTPLPIISGAVEGIVDEAVFRRLVQTVRAQTGPVHGKNGKQQLLARLAGYNRAARFSPWLVLVDLDREADCPPPFVAAKLPAPSELMCFRVGSQEGRGLAPRGPRTGRPLSGRRPWLGPGRP